MLHLGSQSHITAFLFFVSSPPLLLLLSPLILIKTCQGAEDPVIACYYTSWSVNRTGRGKFEIEDIDPFLCTHIIFAFASLDDRGSSVQPYRHRGNDITKATYRRFTSLKRTNHDLKLLLSIGGEGDGANKFSEMASNVTSRSMFIDSCVTFLRDNNFDGLDLDWEYPTLDGNYMDKTNFGLLVKEMKEKFEPHNFLVTASVAKGKSNIDKSYDVKTMARYLDYVYVMTYDYHGSWNLYLHHPSPLHAYHEETTYNKNMNVDFTIKYWLKKGFPPEKIVLGMAVFGRCYILASPEQHHIYDEAASAGRIGPYTNISGVLAYNEICEQQQKQKWNIVRDKNMVSPYGYYDREWCGYEDVISVTSKAHYIKALGLGGAMVWSLDLDDFHGNCNSLEGKIDQTYPLIRTIMTILTQTQKVLATDVKIPDFLDVPKPQAVLPPSEFRQGQQLPNLSFRLDDEPIIIYICYDFYIWLCLCLFVCGYVCMRLRASRVLTFLYKKSQHWRRNSEVEFTKKRNLRLV